MIPEEKLKQYEKFVDVAYTTALDLVAKIKHGKSGHFEEELTLILFEKMLPPIWKI